jgi:diguanylate cyclase (GGDEF)-like protein
MRLDLPLKRLSLAFPILLSILLSYEIILSLAELRTTVNPEIYLSRIALSLAGFFFCILGGWLFSRPVGGLFALAASTLVFLSVSLTKASVLLWFLFDYAILCLLLFRLHDSFVNRLATLVADREKLQNEKNDLDVIYKTKGEGISISFEKYSTYYRLRKFAEELTTNLSLAEIPRVIVESVREFIPRGEEVKMALADAANKQFSVVAAKALNERQVPREGDLFDAWIVSNRKRLIVSDTHLDFRFDPAKTIRETDLRSLIAVPLISEGRVFGTLRLDSKNPETFTTEDLRLLDAIATLASSALSNAKLYEQTKELAIRDSLTGLYVRRYFFERLKEEHSRALAAQRPLSLLMCDLDHFKDCNDRYGHQAGDLMLIQFSNILREFIENAVTARYGGEEFAVLLPATDKEEAARQAEEIRRAVEGTRFEIRRERIAMSVSIGVASLPADTLDLETLVQKADEALYQAKREGRNRVCLSRP